MMSKQKADVHGIRLFTSLISDDINGKTHKIFIFALTAFSYMCLHSIRTCWSFVKADFQETSSASSIFIGTLDLLFLISYATGLFINGWLGDILNLKIFLNVCLLGTSTSVFLIGLFGYLGFYEKWILGILFGLNGFFQSIAWPSCINILSQTFNENIRGTVLSAWSCNQNIGNLMGQLVGHIFLRNLHYKWYDAINFTVLLTFLSFLFNHFLKIEDKKEKIDNHIMKQRKFDSFKEAFCIPGVFQFCCAYGFSRSVVLGILFWLPYYLEKNNFDKNAILLQIQIFEFGNFFGGVILGRFLDIYKIGTFVFPFMLFFSAIFCYLYKLLLFYKFCSLLLIFLIGFFLGGPYNLMSSVVSANLGLKTKENKSLISTVTGIIVGFGSYSAAIFQQIIPYLFFFLFEIFSLFCIFAGLVIFPITWREFKESRIKKEDIYIELT